MTGTEKPAALVVDDDDVFRTRLCRAFARRGWETYGAGSIAEAVRVAQETSPDLSIVDLRIGNESGIEVARRLHEIDSGIVIIMLTGYGSIATALEAVRSGAAHYPTKPVDVEQILTAFETARPTPPFQSQPPAAVPSLARVEWEHIQRVLTDCSGNISQAAKLLGLHRRSLQRKLAKYPPRE